MGYRESSQGPVLRGNIQPWDGRKPAWGYACQEEPCFGQTVVAAIIYGFVGTDKSNDLDHFAK